VVACVSWKATPETLGAASPWIERFQTTTFMVIHVKNKHPLLSEGRLMFFLELCCTDGAIVVGRN